jgi:Ca2+-transporting ATPase
VSPSDRFASGLSEAEAAERLRRDGPNLLPDPERRSVWRILVEVVREPMFALLLAGGVVYLAIGEPKEALILIAFAGLSVSIAVVQGVRSERVLEALRRLTDPQATVIRDGARRRIPSAGLVRGDIIAVAEGERAPADAILRTGEEVEADESLLTGESAPAAKRPSLDEQAWRAPGAEEGSQIYSGSLIVRGQGLAEVVATGPESQIGRIGGALRQVSPPPTRLALETGRIVRIVGLAAIAICTVVVLWLGLVRGAWVKGLLAGIALGMSLLPEEFPLVLTVFMVMGAWRISQAKVLARRASAIETLGSATVLCTDKTGTLTQNRMAVVAAWTSAGGQASWDAGSDTPEQARPLIETGLLASPPHPFDPMDMAFRDAGRGWFARPEDWTLERGFGLSRTRLAVVQVWRDPASSERVAAAKGAPEAIAGLCRFGADRTAEVLTAVEAMAREGMRVLALARGRLTDGEPVEAPDTLPLEFVGLVGLADPLRPGVAEAVARCRSAGVRVVMVTGDYPATARAIAARAGLDSADLLTGEELNELSDEALAARIRGVGVFARILPDQKLKIVKALQASGEVVGMTGDGVNDAPALKAADIGIAMGARGSDVAREAASLVLLDDAFGSIVKAMELGRRIYDNLQKAMGFVLAVHVPIAGLALLPLLLGMPLFLAPAHIALLEMIIDPVCSIVFEAEPGEPDLMARPPRDPEASMFDARRIGLSLLQGLAPLAAAGACLAWGEHAGLHPEAVRTVAFLTLVLGIIGLVQVDRRFSGGRARPNAALPWVLAAVAAMITVIVAAPPLRGLFEFAALDFREVAVALAGGLASFLVLIAARTLARGRSRSAPLP